MIDNFGDKLSEELYHGESTGKTRKFPQNLIRMVVRKLDLLNAAVIVQDLRVPPGNRLEALKGDLAGFYSIRINDQYRIIFRFQAGQASDVKVVDYQ
jgi:toxin HigB-1